MTNSSLRRVLGSSAKMAMATFSSRILGLIRDLAMTSYFGASGVTDSFLVAFRIPNMLRDLFAEGAFSAAFVPVFTEINQKNQEEARRLLWSLFLLLGMITSFISVLIMIFAPELVGLLAPKFLENPDKFDMTVTFIRIMSPFLVFVSLAALFMGVLNTLKIFFIPSLAPAFFNVVMIASIIFLPPVLKGHGFHEVFSLGIGVLVGGLVQLLIQLPLILRRAYGPTFKVKLISKYTGRIVNRLGIGTIGIAATQINLLVATILATGTEVGAVVWLYVAFRLFQFPVGIISVSISGSNLVHFSDAWKMGDKERAISTLRSSYILSFIVIIPAFALLYAMSTESVHLIFEHGKFSSHSTEMAGMALRCYLLGLPFYGLYKIFSPTFYTLDRPQIPVFISVGAIMINIVFCVVFTPIFGFKVLAFGTSLSMFIITIVEGRFLKKMLKLPINFFINIRIIKIFLAGGICLFVVRFLTSILFSFSDVFWKKMISFALVGISGTLLYVILLLALGEFSTLKKLILRRSRL